MSTLSGSPDAIDDAIGFFNENVIPVVKEGGEGAILLVNRETGKGVSITLWASEEARQATEERANALRADAAKAIGATAPPTVDEFEVAVFEL